MAAVGSIVPNSWGSNHSKTIGKWWLNGISWGFDPGFNDCHMAIIRNITGNIVFYSGLWEISWFIAVYNGKYSGLPQIASGND